jgi:hypothetical protein
MSGRWRSGSLTGVVSMLTLAVAFGGLFLGVPNWWVAFIVGYGFVLPAVAMLERGDEEEASSERTDHATTPTSSSPSTTNHTEREGSKNDALETLRDRYARGELSEQQFETKLERLLETETLEDARDTVARSRHNPADDAESTDDERDRELEYE